MTQSTGHGAQAKRILQVDELVVEIYEDEASMARAAAIAVQAYLADRLANQERIRVILATGNSQIQFLKNLIELGGLDWSRMELFHMDEYLGLPADHTASFRRYMKERVEGMVSPHRFHYLNGDCLLPLDECARYSQLLKSAPIDLCCLGIGENGHIAFNDPPVADFDDPHWVKLVQLDEACKQQQVGEGHFPSLEAVPGYALTLTIPALCSAQKMVCLAPETRKQTAVTRALQQPVSTSCPASFLRRQAQATLYLDQDSGRDL